MRLWFTSDRAARTSVSRSLRLFIREVMPAVNPEPIWDPGTAPVPSEAAA